MTLTPLPTTNVYLFIYKNTKCETDAELPLPAIFSGFGNSQNHLVHFPG